MKARSQDLFTGLWSAKCKMCQLTELLTPRKIIDFCCKSGPSMLLQQKCVEWMEMELFHIKIKIVDASRFDREPPQSLTVHYLPRSSLTALEVNGAQIRPSASAFVTLRRTAFDGHTSEASYFCTDSVRTTGKLSFEVYVREETLICGVLQRRENSVKIDGGDQGFGHPTWTVECSCALDDSSTWASTRTVGVASFPTMEVYVAGREHGSVLVLTCHEQLIPRRKRARRQGVIKLDVIPEGNDYDNSFADELEFQGQEGMASFIGGWDKRGIALMCEAATQRLSDFFVGKRVGIGRGRGSDPVSWVHAGMRLGIGMGLGMCVGLCIGTSVLVMRAYQSTTKKSRDNNLSI